MGPIDLSMKVTHGKKNINTQNPKGILTSEFIPSLPFFLLYPNWTYSHFPRKWLNRCSRKNSFTCRPGEDSYFSFSSIPGQIIQYPKMVFRVWANRWSHFTQPKRLLPLQCFTFWFTQHCRNQYVSCCDKKVLKIVDCISMRKFHCKPIV